MNTKDVLLDVEVKIGAILKNNDKARTAFNQQMAIIKNQWDNEISNKCTLAFLVGAVVSACIYGVIFYQMKVGF